MAMVIGAADDPAKGLRQSGADDPVVIGAATTRQTPGAMENIGARPGNRFHDHQPQALARHIDTIAQRVGAEQTGLGLVAENIDQCAGVDRIDMLGIDG